MNDLKIKILYKSYNLIHKKKVVETKREESKYLSKYFFVLENKEELAFYTLTDEYTSFNVFIGRKSVTVDIPIENLMLDFV